MVIELSLKKECPLCHGTGIAKYCQDCESISTCTISKHKWGKCKGTRQIEVTLDTDTNENGKELSTNE